MLYGISDTRATPSEQHHNDAESEHNQSPSQIYVDAKRMLVERPGQKSLYVTQVAATDQPGQLIGVASDEFNATTLIRPVFFVRCSLLPPTNWNKRNNYSTSPPKLGAEPSSALPGTTLSL